jgi:predicted transcriptional regulator
MIKTPCEIIVWEVLPSIRREFAKILIEKHGLSQKEAANKLGVTEAAISRYISGKRASQEVFDGEILSEIEKSASELINGNNSIIIKETCRICNIIKTSKSSGELDYSCGQ